MPRLTVALPCHSRELLCQTIAFPRAVEPAPRTPMLRCIEVGVPPRTPMLRRIESGLLPIAPAPSNQTILLVGATTVVPRL